MDYEEANARFTNKADPSRKKVAWKTWLHRNLGDGRSARKIYLDVLGTTVIEWYPNGSLRLRHRGWKSQLTRRRLDEFLPRPLRIIDCWVRGPSIRGRIWAVKSDGFEVPWGEGIEIASNGMRVDLGSMNQLSATAVREMVLGYAHQYTRRTLIDGIGDDYCAACDERRGHVVDEHVLTHIERGEFPHNLISELKELRRSATPDVRLLGRKPRNQAEQVRKTELQLLGMAPPSMQVWGQRRTLQDAVEETLLLKLGFDLSESKRGAHWE